MQLDKDNRWILSFDQRFSKTFSSPINVELILPGLAGIIYHFKYFCTERCRATIRLQSETAGHDEVGCFVRSTHVSASQASWRILRFAYMDTQRAVVRLHIHMEGYHIW